MDRQIVYSGQIPLETDLLLTNKNAMLALGHLIRATLGTSVCVDGLACAPTAPASAGVTVSPGSLYALHAVDDTAYGTLAPDTATQVMKQYLSAATQTLPCPAPAGTGQSVVYLVQAGYVEADGGAAVLPYYNAAAPNVPWSGPGNAGVSQSTVRRGVCLLGVKAGVAAATGTQATPAPDPGYTGLYAVTVANGQTAVTSGNIQPLAAAPFVGTKLPGVPAAVQAGSTNAAQDASATANVIAVTLTPPPAGLTNLMPVRVKVANANTGATVMNVNGLGNVSVVNADGSALAAGALAANGIYTLAYDANGTRWQVQGGGAAGGGYYFGTTTGGSANAQTLASVTPSGFAKAQGNTVSFTAGFTNTGPTTLNVNGTGATAVKINTTAGLHSTGGGEVVAGNSYAAYFDGTQYVLIDPSTLAYLAAYLQAGNNLSDVADPPTARANLGAAPAASPTFTGTPSAPTAPAATSTTQIATTAFVQAAVAATAAVQSSFKNLSAAWASGTSVSLAADEMTLQTAGNLPYLASAVALTISGAATGANGLDAGSLAANTWYYLYVISNGSAVAGLLSASGTAPALPGGYAYRSGAVGAVLTDGGGVFVGFRQKGRKVQPLVGVNLGALPQVCAGVQGTYGSSYAAVSVAGVVPTAVCSLVKFLYSAVANATYNMAVSPNASYGHGGASATNPPFFGNPYGGVTAAVPFEMMLESASVYVESQANAALLVQGWELNI